VRRETIGRMKVRVNKVNVVLQELAPFRRCNAVAEFAERLFKPGLNQVTQKLREQFGLSGEALQKKALDELRLPAIGCFVAGTLVHTKECLKPIEQIKVGDWVLSRPENPEHGTQTDYKRVVRTMMHHDKPVIHGSFNPLPRLIQGNAYHTDRPAMNLIMTPDHPFWLQGAGWTGAALLREDRSKGNCSRTESLI